MENNNTIWLETASDLLEIQNKIKYLKAKQQMQAKILKQLSGNDGMALDGYKYSPHKREGSIQYKRIPELSDALKAMSIDVEDYRGKDVDVWKLSFTKQFNI